MDNWQELLGDFLEEAYSLLENLEDSLLQLEKKSTDQTSIDTVFRVAHTIKGGAGAVGFQDVSKLTHIMEDVLDLVRQGRYQLSADDITLLLDVKDELNTLLNAHEQGTPSTSEHYLMMIRSLEKTKQSVLSEEKTSSIDVSVENTPSEATPTQYYIDTLPMAARFQLDHELMTSISESLLQNETLLFIEIRFNEEYELKEVGPFEILNIINSFTEPIIMNPSPESLDEEYAPYLNVVVPCVNPPEYVKSKLSLSDVVTSVKVHTLSEQLVLLLEKSMLGEYSSEIDQLPNQDAIIEPVILSQNQEISTNTPNNTQTSNLEEIIESPKFVPNDSTPNEEEKTVKKNQQIEKKSPSIKVESARIDELLNLLGELVIIRSGLGQFSVELEHTLYNARQHLRPFFSTNTLLPFHDDNEINIERNKHFFDDFENINASLDHFMDYIQQLSRISTTLQSQMMNLRMVPVQTVFSRFVRLTRDISKQLQKNVELIIEGGDTEIDKAMIEDLYDPLMHMIRNSLDHGIETPADREMLGKSPKGIIKLKAYHEGDSIFIEVSDNGKGINADKIVEKAIEKNIISTEKALNLSNQEKLALIFYPGLTTAEQISNLSGRGVGMDVVHKNIQDLGGTVAIHSQLGKGTIFRIQLPLTLAIIQGLIVSVENINYVISLSSVEETIIITPQMLHELDHYHAIKFREQLIPLIYLPKILYNHINYSDIVTELTNISHYCVIVRYGSRQVGIIVPDIIQEQDIVVKPLDNRLIHAPGISAATIVGNGDVGFILDLPQIIYHYFKS